MGKKVEDSAARTKVWSSISSNNRQEERNSDRNEPEISDQENPQDDESGYTVQDGEFRVRKKRRKLNYMLLRRIIRRRTTLERKPSMKKSTRNDRTKEMFDLGELLASQNNSQFIIMGISCNPDLDTISHEAYGEYATETMNSSAGQKLLQQFISGWALKKSSFSSGVMKPTEKVLQKGADNTITQVVNGALAVVNKTIARYKKPTKSRVDTTTEKSTSRERASEAEKDASDLEEATSSIIGNQVVSDTTGTETPISQEFDSDGEIDVDAFYTSFTCDREPLEDFLGIQTPVSPGDGNESEHSINDSEEGSFSVEKIRFSKHQLQLRLQTNILVKLQTTLPTTRLVKKQLCLSIMLQSDNVKRGKVLTEKNTQVLRQQSNSGTSVEPDELGLTADATAIIIDDQVHQIKTVRRPVRRPAMKRKAATAAAPVKRKGTSAGSQDTVYICPKCNVNYLKDKGGNQWVQCSNSEKCPTWGHVECMGGDFTCDQCQLQERNYGIPCDFSFVIHYPV